MGGIIWGIGMALMEQTVHDETSGAVINASLADYLLPVNADVPEITVLLVDEQDQHVNSLGVKGLGELGITGSGAAVANAVHHATGRRVRDMPITIEKLL
jgi:xanthine dehydrogenase YagR molybdenum-binding subunit